MITQSESNLHLYLFDVLPRSEKISGFAVTRKRKYLQKIFDYELCMCIVTIERCIGEYSSINLKTSQEYLDALVEQSYN